MFREDATQDEVNKAYDELNIAIEGLVEGSNKPVNPDKPNKPNKPGNGGNLPNTGGTPAGAVGILGVFTAALGFGMFKKKRK